MFTFIRLHSIGYIEEITQDTTTVRSCKATFQNWGCVSVGVSGTPHATFSEVGVITVHASIVIIGGSNFIKLNCILKRGAKRDRVVIVLPENPITNARYKRARCYWFTRFDMTFPGVTWKASTFKGGGAFNFVGSGISRVILVWGGFKRGNCWGKEASI